MIFLAFFTMCTQKQVNKFDIQGHRGARGLLPENTIPAFIKALDLGVSTLELDVVISADQQVVVSHEPWISATICTDAKGDSISKEAQRNHNIYKLNYEEIKTYDCGSRKHPGFPEQQNMSLFKPLLKDVIEAAEAHVQKTGRAPVSYNIEIKSSSKTDNEFHPEPAAFCRLVYETVISMLPLDRVTIQSFDVRVLSEMHKTYPKIKLAYLVEHILSTKISLELMDFTPDIYSPDYELLTQEKVKKLQKKGMKVIPWTVNDPEKMKKLIEWGVDGLITDYPDRYFALQNH